MFSMPMQSYDWLTWFQIPLQKSTLGFGPSGALDQDVCVVLHQPLVECEYIVGSPVGGGTGWRKVWVGIYFVQPHLQ